jgi:putative membrane protein
MSAKLTRAVVTGSFLLASALAPGLAAAQTTQPSQGTKPAGQATRPAGGEQKATAKGSPDSSFINEAAEGGMKEVELGKLAQSRATDSNVKAFAQRMATDHGKANKELMSLAKAKGITLPSSHPAKSTETGAAGTAGSKDMSGELAGLKGAEFDRAYMTNMVEDHEKDVKAFEQEAQSGQDPEVKAWAAKQLPTLREHLSQAKSVRDRLAASK